MDTPLEDNSQLPTATESLNFIEVKPKPEFYSTFSEEEIIEIINYLDSERAVSLKYCYREKLASAWDNFILDFGVSKQFKYTKNEEELLKESWNYINYQIPKTTKINVIEIGPGNSYPMKAFIDQVLSLGRMNSYVAIDISQEMLNISRENIFKWFPKLKFFGYKCDMEKAQISQIISEQSTDNEPDNIINVIICLGGTIYNHKERGKIFKNIKMGMRKNELFIFTSLICSTANWDGKLLGGSSSAIYQMCEYIRDILGIRREDSEIISKFDSAIDSRIANIKLNENHSIEFNISQGKSNKVLLLKNEEINVWRHHSSTILKILTEVEQSGLQLVYLSTDRDLSEVMVICQAANL